MLCTLRASDGSCRKMPSTFPGEGRAGRGHHLSNSSWVPIFLRLGVLSPVAVEIPWNSHPNPGVSGPWGHFVLQILLEDVGAAGASFAAGMTPLGWIPALLSQGM